MSTAIEWTDETWNPVVGCSIVSPGCKRCYAMKMAHRVGPNFAHYAGLTELTKGGPVWTGKVATSPEHIFTAPLRWRRPRRIFVNSMSDLFHESIAEETIDRVFAVMALTPHHTYQVLTKRAERMRTYLGGHGTATGRIWFQAMQIAGAVGIPAEKAGPCMERVPLPNVWLGVSCERQQEAEERIPQLLATPAAVRWISAEPPLWPLRLDGWLRSKPHDTVLDWVVAGGESGPGARPAHPDWFRSLRDQCAAAGVPYFFKQWGNWAPFSSEKGGNICHVFRGQSSADDVGMVHYGKKAAGNLLDGRVHQEWPR